jgi:hypothetical protein
MYCYINIKIKEEVIELKSLVVEYVRERGNDDASEVLNDYMNYLHLHGYAIRHNSRNHTQTNLKPLIVHLEDQPSNQPQLAPLIAI